MIMGRAQLFLFTIMFTTFSAGNVRADGLEEAVQAHAQGVSARALELLPAAPDDPLARMLRARILLDEGGAPLEAIKLLDGLHRARALKHLGDLAHFMMGEARLAAGEPRAAARSFRRAERWRGSRWVDRARLKRAEAIAAFGDHRFAVTLYQGILKLYPEHPQRLAIQLRMARSLTQSRRPKEAAAMLQTIWLENPATPAAAAASRQLQGIRDAGVKVERIAWPGELDRAKRLRRAKILTMAEAELMQLRERHERSRSKVYEIDRELVRAYMKWDRPDKALPIAQALIPKTDSPGRLQQLRWVEADAMAGVGQARQAAEGLMKDALDRKGRVHRKRLADVRRAFRVLVRHGEYAAALKLLDGPLAKERPIKLRRTRAWLAYRSGDLERAIKELEPWTKKRSRSLRAVALYWQARAHQRAGRKDRAIALYNEVRENHLRSYYGTLARSRLSELGVEGVLEPGGKCQPNTAPEGPPPPSKVPAMLSSLVKDHGDLFPSLRRAETLWMMGMKREARREMTLATLAFGMAESRGKGRHWHPREEVERVHAGGPAPRRRWDKQTRKIYRKRDELRPRLADLLAEAQIFYYSWKLRTQGKRRTILQLYPRAYEPLVRATARAHRLDPNLLWAIMRTESTYRPDAVSRVGATGLMQIMPSTGRRLQRAMDVPGFYHQQLYSPELNLRMAGWYLRAVLDKFKEQLPLVAAAYNGGPHNVAKWLRRRGGGADLDEFVEEIPFSESRRYGKKILRLVALYERVHCGKDDRLQSNKLDAAFLAFPGF